MADGVKTAALAALRQHLALIERGGRAPGPVLPFGVPAIDAALPGGGLARGALHEVGGLGAAAEEGAEAVGFLAGILARLEPGRPVLWCLARADLHPPGLAAHGLAPARLVRGRRPRNGRCSGPWRKGSNAAISPPWSARSRRFRTSRAAGCIWPPRPAASPPSCCAAAGAAPAGAEPSAAVTRWRIAASPSHPAGGRVHPADGLGRTLWHVALLRCRGGVPGQWLVEAGDAAGHVHLAEILADRPAAPQRRRAAR